MAVMVLAILVVGVSSSALPGVGVAEGFDPLLDGWLKGAAYVTAAGLVVLRPLTSPVRRRGWAWIAAALTARAMGFILHLSVFRWMDPVPYPSVADGFWVLSAVLLLVGLVEFMRESFPRRSTAVAFDAVLGALAAAALAVQLLHEFVASTLSAAELPTAALATNLAYPVLDVGLLLAVVALVASHRWRPPVSTAVLAVGVLGLAGADALFLYQVAAGTFRPGALLSVLSLSATAGIAVAAWVSARDRPLPDRFATPDMAVPAVFGLVSLGLLVYGTQRPLVDLAVGLAAAGLVVAVVRAAHSFRLIAEVSRMRHGQELARRANQELSAVNARLADAARVKDDLISMASHELRTPLTPILGFVELLEARGDNLSDKQRTILQSVRRNARRMLGLVDDLLVINRATTETLRSLPEAILVRDHVLGVLDDLGEIMAGVEVTIGEKCSALVDPQQFDQMIANLLTNATKYGAPPVVVRAATTGTRVVIEVEDHGPGVPVEFQPLMWERFTQRDHGDRRTSRGTGLGLAIVKLLAELNHGTASHRDPAETGAVFFLDLPSPTDNTAS